MQIIRVVARLIPLLILLAIPQVGHSQSFDCRHAETDTEWAICNTPDLSHLDDNFAASYQKFAGPETKSPQLRKKAEQMRTSWIHGRRDLCAGNVGCLVKAYRDILDALQALPYTDAATVAAQECGECTIPRCGTTKDKKGIAFPSAAFAKAVCGNKDLLDEVRRIAVLADQLRPRLAPSWRMAFDAQQAAFPQVADNCPEPTKVAQCVTQAVNQRLQDLADFAASLDKPVPACKPSEVSIKDSDAGDGGMSKIIKAYLIQYDGTASCSIRGYPTVLVYEAKGTPQPTYADYSGRSYFTQIVGAPLPVTFSSKNRTAWFAISTASACDSVPGGFRVKIALPLSREWLRTIDRPDANCPDVSITPVGMISTLLSSIK